MTRLLLIAAAALLVGALATAPAAAQPAPPSPTPTVTPAPTPFPTRTVLEPSPPGAFEIVGAGAAILMALAAGFLGYRVIRGGRGL